jgi:hypothetical protein
VRDSYTDPPAADDPLEAELRTFRPAGPSRELFARVEAELALDIPAPPPRARTWIAGSLLAAAACVLVAALLWHSTRSPGRGHIDFATTVPTAPRPAGGPDDSRPALAAYRRALSRSPEALDELLDRHAARLLPGDAGADAATTFRVTASSDLGTLR